MSCTPHALFYPILCSHAPSPYPHPYPTLSRHTQYPIAPLRYDRSYHSPRSSYAIAPLLHPILVTLSAAVWPYPHHIPYHGSWTIYITQNRTVNYDNSYTYQIITYHIYLCWYLVLLDAGLFDVWLGWFRLVPWDSQFSLEISSKRDFLAQHKTHKLSLLTIKQCLDTAYWPRLLASCPKPSLGQALGLI